MPPNFYIAGPFFNEEQIDLIQRIEITFADAGIPFFSPRLQSGNQKKGPIDAARASEIFRSNVVNIHNCDAMLAVLDWKLPSNQQVWLAEDLLPGKLYAPLLKAKLHIPDSGTVYEMGYAHHAGKPVVIYTERPKEAPLNLMLTQGTRGVINGIEELRHFLNLNDITQRGRAVRWADLEPWEGRNS